MSKKKLMIKITASILIALQLAAGAHAADALITEEDAEQTAPRVSVVSDISASLLNGKIDIIDSLDIVSSRWLAMENTASIEAVASFSNYPFEPLEGRKCLTALSADADASAWRYINYEPASPLDLSEYNTFFYAVNVPRLSGGRTRTALMLYSADGAVFSVSADLTTETWDGVIADISAFEERSEISRIRIGVQHNYGQNANYPYGFQIDCLAASHDRLLAHSLRFMSGSYLVYGGDSALSYDYNPMKMTVSVASVLAAECFIESRIPPSDTFLTANCIRLRLANESSCSSVTMEYATPDSPAYADNKPVTINLVTGRDIAAYYFPIPDGSVTQIKFSFNGASEGDIHIYSITPVEFYSPLPSGYTVLSPDHGSLTSCRLTDDEKKILIAGTMTEAGVAQYKNQVIELYELKPWQNNEYIFEDEASPIMSAAVASQFTFEIDAEDRGGSLINSRFIAAVNGKNGNEPLMISGPRYITNPETKAPDRLPGQDRSVKGFIAGTPVLAEAGVSLTALRINLGELPVAADNSITYEYEGGIYHFSADYVESMDRQLDDLYIAGVTPILVFTLDESGKTEQAASLIHPGAITRTLNDSYAFNIDTAEGTTYLGAVCDFLVRRYSGRIAGITVGNAIDNAYLNYNMGKRTLAYFADGYCRAFRVVYNTVRSVDSGIRVYISIGNSWDKCMTTDPALSYCGRDLTDIIGEQLRREGNIAWHLAADPYNAEFSVNSLLSLCDYLKRDDLLYENASRRILLLSHDADYYNDNRDARQLAAEYIAAFLALSSDACSAVDGFIVRDNPDFASDGIDFYKILRYIDTDRAPEHVAIALDILGITEWKELIPDYRSGGSSGRIFHEKTMADSLPDKVTGTISLAAFESDDSLGKWTVSSPAISLSAQNDFKGYKNMLFAEYGAMTADSMCALTHTFEYKRDLSYAPFLSFNIYTDNLPPSVRSLTLTVTVIADGGIVEFASPLRSGEWRYAVCDLSDLSAAKNVKSITFRLSAPDDLSGVRLVIGEIFATSLRYDNRFLETKFLEERDKYLAGDRAPMNRLIVWILIGVIVTASVIEVINISRRVKRNEGEKKTHAKNGMFRMD